MKKLSTYTVTLSIFLSLLSYSELALAKNSGKVYTLCNVKKGAKINLYEDPVKHSKVVARLPHNCRLIKEKGIKKYSHSQWQKVSWNKKSGWLKNGCLKLEQNKKSPTAPKVATK